MWELKERMGVNQGGSSDKTMSHIFISPEYLCVKSRDLKENAMAELMYIPNEDKQDYSLCKLQLLVETFGY